MKNFSDFGKPQGQETGTGQSRAKDTDVAWLAGIVDGEGCFSVTFGGKERRSITPRLAIGNTSMLMMNRIQQIVSCVSGKIYKIRARDNKTPNVVFVVEITSQKALKPLLVSLIPHLTVKQQQAKEVLAFCNSRAQRVNYHDGYTEWEQGIAGRLKTMNRAHFVHPTPGVETKREAPSTIH